LGYILRNRVCTSSEACWHELLEGRELLLLRRVRQALFMRRRRLSVQRRILPKPARNSLCTA